MNYKKSGSSKKSRYGNGTSKRKSKVKKPMTKGKRIALDVLIGAAIVCCVTALIVISSVLIHAFSFVHGDLAINLEDYKDEQSQTSFVYAYKNNDKSKPVEVTRLYGTENRVWVDMDKMNAYIGKCFVALEDKRFYEHKGVDWKRTISAATIYGGSQGGSTITQQLIKNLTNENEVTFVRKFNEILKALNLERSYDKEKILEAYLNTVYLSEGCYGVETAAEMYFGKSIGQCNLAESACIASITQYPSKYDPLMDAEANKVRQQFCLKNMLDQKLITQQEYDEAVNYELKFNKKGIKNNNVNGTYSYYTDTLINQVINDLMVKYGYTEREATHMLYYGGLRIYSAVDLNVQKSIDSIYTTRDYVADGVVQSSMTIMDYKGRVVGIVGGVGKKSGMRELNRASDSPRQPGSTIKPVTVYGPGIDTGSIYWSEKFEDSPSLTVDGKPWPKNQSNRGTYNYYTVQYALANSLNTISARCLTELGLETSYDYAKNKFMLGHLDDNVDVNYSSLAVGGMEYGTTTLEMAAAYATFGNGGTYYQPWFYYNVTDAEGNVILDRSNYDNHQAIDESSAEIMNRLLRTVMTEGTGTYYNVSGQTCFGKTGTTTDDYDRWFCGGTPYYVAAVWYGYDKPSTISNVYTNPSGRLFKLVMDKVHSGYPSKQFPTASSGVKTASFCSVSGKLSTSSCGAGGYGYYRTDYMPQYCYSHEGYYNTSTRKPEATKPESTTGSGEPPSDSTQASDTNTTAAVTQSEDG